MYLIIIIIIITVPHLFQHCLEMRCWLPRFLHQLDHTPVGLPLKQSEQLTLQHIHISAWPFRVITCLTPPLSLHGKQTAALSKAARRCAAQAYLLPHRTRALASMLPALAATSLLRFCSRLSS
jgi:hypothetical protein